MTTVYFNGAFLPKDEVRISPDDRGFLFADGLYEVVRSYEGRLFELDAHMDRLSCGLEAVRITGVDIPALRGVISRLLEVNDLASGDATVYVQITRGAASRVHAFPDPEVPPTVYAEPRRFAQRADPAVGVSVITVPDVRWARCDIKSVALLPNCLANQRAREAGAIEAIFVRDGVALEATASSFFAVFGGEVRTAPATNYILPSITRAVVLRICGEEGMPAREIPVLLDELGEADELFLAGTTLEVMPIISIDSRPVGGGVPGPIARKLGTLFQQKTGP